MSIPLFGLFRASLESQITLNSLDISKIWSQIAVGGDMYCISARWVFWSWITIFIKIVETTDFNDGNDECRKKIHRTVENSKHPDHPITLKRWNLAPGGRILCHWKTILSSALSILGWLFWMDETVNIHAVGVRPRLLSSTTQRVLYAWAMSMHNFHQPRLRRLSCTVRDDQYGPSLIRIRIKEVRHWTHRHDETETWYIAVRCYDVITDHAASFVSEWHTMVYGCLALAVILPWPFYNTLLSIHDWR